MAIYSVKYNPSLTYIPGATQVGTLAVAIGDVDYSTGGWVAGVSDDNGYVIYSDTSSLNLVGRKTGGGTGTASSNIPTFYRSGFKTDSSLLQLINRIPGNTQSFNDINSAKVWLNNAAHVNILGGTYSGGGASSPTASYIITLTQVGSNIVMAGSGTLNIDDLRLIAGATGPSNGSGIGINTATLLLGAVGKYYDLYGGILTYPINFGTGSGFAASSSAGDIVGVLYNMAPPHLLAVPAGYTSGSYLTGSQTFNNKTFNSLGLVAGTYSYTWGTGSNAEMLSVVVGTASGGGGGGATGSGSWYFYAAEGDLGINGPPTTDGQAIFTDNLPAGGTNVTFNPNKSSGVNFLNFNLQDSAGTDYTTQFTNLKNNGGTISVIQNGIIATYTLDIGMAFIQSGPGFVSINTDASTQTVNAASPFVYGDPISISFS